jgi:hypothetical protein
MGKKRITLTAEERHRRSIQITVRNAWVKEGSPGGDAELARRRADPKVLGPLYKKKGWDMPAEVAASEPPPARPPGAPKKGPPQPPRPPKAKASPPAAPAAADGLETDLFD